MEHAERRRVEGFGHLEDGLRQASPWYVWGPYLSERAWGTVREDYSPGGTAWEEFPHDHARSRAYRWSEDGLAGLCDVEQRLCLALALWNGRDPILKERVFGLTGSEGNHGEDAKEYWWYLDALPSHAWARWRYHYPQQAFPYADLVAGNRRGKDAPEYELLDTGVFDHGYWIVEVTHAKATPDDILVQVTATNAGEAADTLHILPTVWFRNTWSWDPHETKPELRATSSSAIGVDHPRLGALELAAGPGPDGSPPALLFCENETNAARLWGVAPGDGSPRYPKDGINDHVVSGAATVDPERRGTKASCWYRAEVPPGESVELRLRLRPAGGAAGAAEADLGAGFARVLDERRAEADEFYDALRPEQAGDDEYAVMRQAFAGMLWSKQFYHYDVARWLDGDPAQPQPPLSRLGGRNSRWRTFSSFDILSMPDTWEYPWFAAWDLAFHCVALAHVDPAFAKYQLTLLCREWFQHPSGALPAYEWSFDDVNPPVQAWAALQVYRIDGGRDRDFLWRVFIKLLLNFTWWLNLEDADGNNLFEGGFLGLDNIGPIDRSHLPPGCTLEQSDASGWMAFYCLSMLGIGTELGMGEGIARDLGIKFLEHFVSITRALNRQGLWDETDGLYYDRFRRADGTTAAMRVRSMAGLVPMLAAATVDEGEVKDAAAVRKLFARLLAHIDVDAADLRAAGYVQGVPGSARLLLGIVPPAKLARLCQQLFDEESFLSPYGLRSLSRYHRDHPYAIDIGGAEARIDYEPAESTTGMFGGNSNWRGPVWFPLNYLVISALERYAQHLGDTFTVEYPTGSGRQLTLGEIADDLRQRLVSLFLVGADGRRPAYGWVERLQHDPAWRDNIMFFEYFHGDNGAGLGACHQTGWTGLVADLIVRGGAGPPPR